MSVEGDETRPVAMAFEPSSVVLPVSAIVPLKTLREGVKGSRKYAQILKSVRAIGLVEAPVVIPNARTAGSYFLLDGHLRIEALKDLGVAEVECLVATDDEAFTYNKHVNRLGALQEHRMVSNALRRGVPPERIAEAFGTDVATVSQRARLVDGICPGAIDLLRGSAAPAPVFGLFRRMNPVRQVEAAELMVDQGNFTTPFARALLAATPERQLVVAKGRKPKSVPRATAKRVGQMERELAGLQDRVRSVAETYGIDHLHLTVARAYVAKLLGNARIAAWLAENRPEYLEGFQSIAGAPPPDAVAPDIPHRADPVQRKPRSASH